VLIASTPLISNVLEHKKLIAKAMLCLCFGTASAGPQREEHLADSVRIAMSSAVADLPPPTPYLPTPQEQASYQHWLAHTQAQLERKLQGKKGRPRLPELSSPELQQAFLQTVWYESRRAGLEPALVMGLIEVESGFRKFAISSAGARGVMQVMPFWTRQLGISDASALFQWQANMRFGCVILRHYLSLEQGNMHMALGRYNGSRGQLAYPQAVLAAQRRWQH
jgi:soluble lytic murein transglycosylase-like protein